MSEATKHFGVGTDTRKADPDLKAGPASKPKAAAKSSGPWGEVVTIKASGTTFADATQIESAGPWTIVNVDAARHHGAELDQHGVILPVDAAIGDLVELYVNGYTGRVFTPEGDSFAYADERASADIGSSALFRKVSEKGWRYVAGS